MACTQIVGGSHGGDGDDRYAFNSTSESVVGDPDVIQNFNFGRGGSLGDKIDVATIDANTLISGNEAFTFIGSDPFSAAGQLRVTNGPDGDTLIQGNVDGVLAPDLEIQVQDGAILPGDYIAGDYIL